MVVHRAARDLLRPDCVLRRAGTADGQPLGSAGYRGRKLDAGNRRFLAACAAALTDAGHPEHRGNPEPGITSDITTSQAATGPGSGANPQVQGRGQA